MIRRYRAWRREAGYRYAAACLLRDPSATWWLRKDCEDAIHWGHATSWEDGVLAAIHKHELNTGAYTP